MTLRNHIERSVDDKLIVNVLVWLGLAELPTIRRYGKHPGLEVAVTGDYTTNQKDDLYSIAKSATANILAP